MPMTVFVSYGHPRGDCTLVEFGHDVAAVWAEAI